MFLIGGVACWLAGFGLIASAAVGVAVGDSNSGDVWVDNVGQPSGPGHEMDPHLGCQDINLWGADLADSGDGYTVDGWSPSGSGTGDQAWPGTKADPGTAAWSYDTSTGGSQVISTIDVTKLIADAVANGDAPVNGQGYHFKLEFSQDPLKHKTFWVSCQAPAPTPTATPKPTHTPGSTPTPKPTPTPGSTPTPKPTPTGGGLGASTSSPTPSPSSTGRVLGAGTSTPTTGAGSGAFWGGSALVLLGMLLLGAAATVRRWGFPIPN
ncbi:MAG TPA: hypothetical protein VNH38_07790 [Candidatus Dormibacteraeota bacterium]|nr:hypothetical protein [Candidatus Dormibacteraeota bacterium]